MNPWHLVTREVTRLARSIWYEQRHRAGRDDFPEYDAYTRRPRPWLVGGAVAGTAAIGVVGTYLVLAGGLGGWLIGPSGPVDPGRAPGGSGPTGAVYTPAAPAPPTGRVPHSRGSGHGSTGTPAPSASGTGTSTPPPTGGATPSPSPPVSPSPSVSPSPEPSASTTPPPVPGPSESSSGPPHGHGHGSGAALGPPPARHAAVIPSTAMPGAA